MIGRASFAYKDVCIMAFLGLHDLIRRIFQSAAISVDEFALLVCVMRSQRSLVATWLVG